MGAALAASSGFRDAVRESPGATDDVEYRLRARVRVLRDEEPFSVASGVEREHPSVLEQDPGLADDGLVAAGVNRSGQQLRPREEEDGSYLTSREGRARRGSGGRAVEPEVHRHGHDDRRRDAVHEGGRVDPLLYGFECRVAE